MNKAKTLPRTKRDKSPSPSSTSFSSLKSATFGFKGLIRKKKKRKDSSSSDPPAENGNLNVTEELSEEVVGPPEANSTPAVESAEPAQSTEISDIPIEPTPELLKSPKKPKPPIKKIVKGGKGILQKFRNKNESAPIMVESAGLDLRREPTKKDETDEETDGAVRQETDQVTEMSVVSKDEWSTTATCEKVRKLSQLEFQNSVYDEDVDGETSSNPTTPLDETFIDEEKALSRWDPNSVVQVENQTPINFDKKSPSTIKKEILSSINSVKSRKTSDPIPNGSRDGKTRKISMQERNSTDKSERLYKILVIGELGTGKTSIIKRYVHQFFSQHYRATIGVDFALKVLNWDEDTTIRLQLWDIAGQERFGNMTRVYYKEAVGAFIVFDVTRVGTFEAVVKWKQDLDAKVQLPDGETIPCVLLANKCDQPKEGLVNSNNKMDEFCRENQFLAWFETSAKDNINIDEAANCLVTKIVQTDEKRPEEKEMVNGSLVINITNGIGDSQGKSCNC